VVREFTSSLPEGLAKLEGSVEAVGEKLDRVESGVGTQTLAVRTYEEPSFAAGEVLETSPLRVDLHAIG